MRMARSSLEDSHRDILLTAVSSQQILLICPNAGAIRHRLKVHDWTEAHLEAASAARRQRGNDHPSRYAFHLITEPLANLGTFARLGRKIAQADNKKSPSKNNFSSEALMCSKMAKGDLQVALEARVARFHESFTYRLSEL